MKRALAVLLLVAAAASEALTCKYDGATLWWQGKVRIMEGRMEYLCGCGLDNRHQWWLDKSDCSE